MTQLWHQLWKRLAGGRRRKRLRRIRQAALPGGNSVKAAELLIPALDYDEGYLARFGVEELMEDRICLLHEKHLLNHQKWEIKEASHLWNYNLHYLEFLIPLAVAAQKDSTGKYYRKWCEYVNSWIEHRTADSFAPYTISMRIPNLLICMSLLQEKLEGTVIKRKLMDSIYKQYRYLLVTQEKALLANHYFENIKTILICSVVFEEDKNQKKYFRKFLQQIEEQILEDGIHYERSVMYHRIILEDILRVYVVWKNRAGAEKLRQAIEMMADALASISRGFGGTPLFNDAGDNVARDTDSLLKAVQAVTGYSAAENQTAFVAAGYYKLYAGRNALLFDCGQLGPSYMGGHSHCDCLSFEMARDGKALFVNSGTYQYQGSLRKFFRSTAAHNTVMIDDREQAELWGEHRAARRMSAIACETGKQTVKGRFRSFRGDCFTRKIELTESAVLITDCVEAKDRKWHCARQFLHIAPDCHLTADTQRRISVWDSGGQLAVIDIPEGSDGLIHRDGTVCFFAQDFGELKSKEVLEIRTLFVKKAELQIGIWLLQEKER